MDLNEIPLAFSYYSTVNSRLNAFIKRTVTVSPPMVDLFSIVIYGSPATVEFHKTETFFIEDSHQGPYACCVADSVESLLWSQNPSSFMAFI